MKVEEVQISKIKSNPYQTREKVELEPLKILTKSIRERGLLSPITVLQDLDGFVVVAGHRRLAAFKRMKKKTIPAFIKTRKKDNTLMVDLVHENLIREDLTPLEKANSIRLLFSQIKSTRDDPERMYTLINMLKNFKRRGYYPEHQKKKTTGFEENDIFRCEKILKSLGISENNAVTYLMLLRLPRSMSRNIIFNKSGVEAKGRLVIKQAEQLARIGDPKYREHLYQRCLKGANCRIIQAHVNIYVEKLEKGEWNGFQKKLGTFHKFKDDIKVMESVREDCRKISARITSFKCDTLLKLEGTLEKEDFIAHIVDLKKELDLLTNSVEGKLEDKGYKEILNPEEIDSFEVCIKKSIAKKNYRFTFPSKIAKKLELSETEKEFLKLKIVGIRK